MTGIPCPGVTIRGEGCQNTISRRRFDAGVRTCGQCSGVGDSELAISPAPSSLGDASLTPNGEGAHGMSGRRTVAYMRRVVDAYDSQDLPWPAQTAAELINTLDEDYEGLEGLVMALEERRADASQSDDDWNPEGSEGILDDMSAQELVDRVREIIDAGPPPTTEEEWVASEEEAIRLSDAFTDVLYEALATGDTQASNPKIIAARVAAIKAAEHSSRLMSDFLMKPGDEPDPRKRYASSEDIPVLICLRCGSVGVLDRDGAPGGIPPRDVSMDGCLSCEPHQVNVSPS